MLTRRLNPKKTHLSERRRRKDINFSLLFYQFSPLHRRINIRPQMGNMGYALRQRLKPWGAEPGPTTDASATSGKDAPSTEKTEGTSESASASASTSQAAAGSASSPYEVDLDSIINRLLEVRGYRLGKQVQLLSAEIRYLCPKAREIFISQPMLLELEAPLTVGQAQTFRGLCAISADVVRSSIILMDGTAIFSKVSSSVDFHLTQIMCSRATTWTTADSPWR
jgi:hypothetical protein